MDVLTLLTPSSTRRLSIEVLRYRSLLTRLEYMVVQYKLYQEEFQAAVGDRFKRPKDQKEQENGTDAPQNSFSGIVAMELAILGVEEEEKEQQEDEEETSFDLLACKVSARYRFSLTDLIKYKETLEFVNQALQVLVNSLEGRPEWRYGECSRENADIREFILGQYYYPSELQFLQQIRDLNVQEIDALKKANAAVEEQIAAGGGWGAKSSDAQFAVKMIQDQLAIVTAEFNTLYP